MSGQFTPENWWSICSGIEWSVWPGIRWSLCLGFRWSVSPESPSWSRIPASPANTALSSPLQAPLQCHTRTDQLYTGKRNHKRNTDNTIGWNVHWKIRKPVDNRRNRMREKLFCLRDGQKRLPAWTPYTILLNEPLHRGSGCRQARWNLPPLAEYDS